MLSSDAKEVDVGLLQGLEPVLHATLAAMIEVDTSIAA